MIIEVNDLSLPELDVYARLTEAQLRRQEDVFLAEGVKVISAALDAGCEPVSMLCEARHLAGKAAPLAERLRSVPVYTACDELLAALTGYELHRGMLAAFRQPKPRGANEILARSRTVCVLEGLTDTTNMGAILRSAAALGIDAVLLTPDCCDPLSRRAIKVSMGTVFRVPWARLDSIRLLRDNGFLSAALALTDESVPLTHPALKQAERLALCLGSEGSGLRPETIRACDVTVKIPMAPGVDSLNVAAAAAVAFWEIKRV